MDGAVLQRRKGQNEWQMEGNEMSTSSAKQVRKKKPIFWQQAFIMDIENNETTKTHKNGTHLAVWFGRQPNYDSFTEDLRLTRTKKTTEQNKTTRKKNHDYV